MAEEVSDSSSQLSDADLDAIATYLKDQRAETSASTSPSGQRSSDDGGCGDLSGPVLRLPQVEWHRRAVSDSESRRLTSVAARDPTTLIRVVLEGAQSVATNEEPTGPAMPAFGWQLNDAEIAAVTTYVRNSWDHATPPVTEHAVHEARSKLAREP